MPKHYISNQIQDNLAIAKQILADFPDTRIFCLYGNLGAGKTTFVKSFCEALGVKEAVTSPTFALVNEYQGESTTIYHFDFYRIKSEEEVYDMGYEEYFFADAYCFIEWAERISNLVPDEAIAIYITTEANGERVIEIRI